MNTSPFAWVAPVLGATLLGTTLLPMCSSSTPPSTVDNPNPAPVLVVETVTAHHWLVDEFTYPADLVLSSVDQLDVRLSLVFTSPDGSDVLMSPEERCDFYGGIFTPPSADPIDEPHLDPASMLPVCVDRDH